MASLQVKNLPIDLHRAVAARARAEGTTISELVTRILRREMSRPTTAEWIALADASIPRGSPRDIDTVGALDAVRADYGSTAVATSTLPDTPTPTAT